MTRFEDHGVALADVQDARGGNAIGPGLGLFTGLSFLVYLLVKLAAGGVAIGPDLLVQLAIAAGLLLWGGWVMRRGRYHFVTIRTAEGPRQVKGLSRAERVALLEAFAAKGAPSGPSRD